MKHLNVIELEQRSSDWHHVRAVVHGLCTASNAGYFLNRDGKFAHLMRDDYSLVKLYRLAKGLITEKFTPEQLEAMDNGTKKEPMVRSILENKHSIELLDIIATSKEAHMSHFLVSYDGLDYVNNKPYEIKVSSNEFIFRKVAQKGLDGHIGKYIPQVQMQMAITNASEAVLAVYGTINGEEKVLEFKIERDDEMIEEILTNSRNYFENYFQKDIEPPANELDPILTQPDDEFWMTQAAIIGSNTPKLNQLKEQIKEIEAKIKKAESEIQQKYLQGEQKVITGMGVTVKSSRKTPSIAWKKYAEHLMQTHNVKDTEEKIKEDGYVTNTKYNASSKIDLDEFERHYNEDSGSLEPDNIIGTSEDETPIFF
jgi:hypothetical protein